MIPEVKDIQSYIQEKGVELQHCAIKLSVLKTSLHLSRDEVADDAMTNSTKICFDVGISSHPSEGVG